MNSFIKILLFPILLFTQFSFSQVIGSVKDTNNIPLPYVNIYTEDGKNGTTTNEDGDFELRISEPGEYDLVFQYLD